MLEDLALADLVRMAEERKMVHRSTKLTNKKKMSQVLSSIERAVLTSSGIPNGGPWFKAVPERIKRRVNGARYVTLPNENRAIAVCVCVCVGMFPYMLLIRIHWSSAK